MVDMKKPFDIEKLIRIPSVYPARGAYGIAPDGKTAAVVSDKSGHWEIYLVPLRGRGKPKQITAGPESKFAPEFSPDGARLAFCQDYSGDENHDIFIYDLRTGATRNLTPDTPDETINPYLAWSPDGKRLAFVSNRAGQFATYIIDVDEPSQVKRVTQHSYSDSSAEWSPAGQYLAVNALGEGQDTWVILVALDSGATKIVGGAEGPVDASMPRWAPDGRRIVFQSNTPGICAIMTYDLATGALTTHPPLTNEAVEPDWSPDGARLAFTWNEDGNVELALRDLATGKDNYVTVGPGVHSFPRFSRDGKHLLFLFSGPGNPTDLWVLDCKTGRKRQLTRSLPRAFAPDDFVTPEVVRWASEGWTISGLLYKPRRRTRARLPAVVYVHGGPTWQLKNEWWATIQHLVSHGYIVLAPNYRGSTGYGKAFQEANRFDLGGGDMRDVIAGAEYLVHEHNVDPAHIAITGTSYGGYLTMTALTKYPRVFAAGSAIVPFLNWFTEHANERKDLQYWDEQNFGDPLKDAARYREYSPIFFMEDIAAPVQMIAGAHDPRCPASETEQAAGVLKDLNVPHEIVIYPDEGHGFQKVDNRVEAYRQRAEFLNRYLLVGKRKSR